MTVIIDTALALVDAHHAELDRKRKQFEQTLDAIRALMSAPTPAAGAWRSADLRVGEAAKAVGVRPSALRFWEQQGLLKPERDARSGYRVYGQRQMRQLEVVALLRGVNYGFNAIRLVLDELTAGRFESTLRAVEKRRTVMAASSRACIAATAALWCYICDAHQDR